MTSAKADADIRELSQRYGLPIDPNARTGDLPVGLQQRVEILKVLYRGADILIMDEPTGVLTPQETDELFRVLRGLVQQGKTIIFITHKLREVLEISDTVTVLRRGRKRRRNDHQGHQPSRNSPHDGRSRGAAPRG